MVTPAIFLPGKMCGEDYVIQTLRSRSPVSETYLARHLSTRKQVVLTCSRFSHDPSGPPISTTFISTVGALSRLRVSNAPRVLNTGIDSGVYWVVREHFEDAVSLVSFMAGEAPGSGHLADLQEQFEAEPYKSAESLALKIGILLSDALGQFAAEGFIHGGLDPNETIALRGDGTPIVLETGYGSLFGKRHFEPAGGAMDLRAPEQKAGAEPDMRSDIFTLGIILGGLLHTAAHDQKSPRLLGLVTAVNQAVNEDREKRIQSWKALANSLLLVQAGLFEVKAEGEGEPSDEDDAPASSGAARKALPSAMQSPMDPCASPPTSRVPEMPLLVVDLSGPAPTPANDLCGRGPVAEPTKAPSEAARLMKESTPSPPRKAVAKANKRARWERWGAALALLVGFGWLLDAPPRRPAAKARSTLRTALAAVVNRVEPLKAREAVGAKASNPVVAKTNPAEIGVRARMRASAQSSECPSWAACSPTVERPEAKGSILAALSATEIDLD